MAAVAFRKIDPMLGQTIINVLLLHLKICIIHQMDCVFDLVNVVNMTQCRGSLWPVHVRHVGCEFVMKWCTEDNGGSEAGEMSSWIM